MKKMVDPVTTSEGLTVLHLFCNRTSEADDEAVLNVVRHAAAQETQVVTVAVLGHKAELCFMALHVDAWVLRDFQTALVQAGLTVVDSYVSLTELSEYATGMSPKLAAMRLNPELPPGDKSAWCFYTMNKRRNRGQNWYELPFEERQEMMYEHGASGRQFTGRVTQLVTGSSGLDDWEWAVTLFGVCLNDLKETVYTMRYDRVSAAYAEFGPFIAGLTGPADEILRRTLVPLNIGGPGSVA